MDFTLEVLGLSLAHWLVVLSAVLSVIGSGAYIRDTLKGTTKPNRVSFSMWALAPLIGTAAAISAGADSWPTVGIFMEGFMPLLIFLASFINPQSYWRLSLFDILCGACSVVAIIIWVVIDAPVMAILFAAIGDGFAALPTIRKAWLYPETETGLAYTMSFFAALVVIPSIPVWNIENASFQTYLLVANTFLLFAVYRKRFGLTRVS